MHIKLTKDEHALLWRHEESAKLLTDLNCAPDALQFSCSKVELDVFTDTCCHLLITAGIVDEGRLNEDGQLLDGLIERTFLG
jgi:hypothetical protein